MRRVNYGRWMSMSSAASMRAYRPATGDRYRRRRSASLHPGTERKTICLYYTRPELVQELISPPSCL